MSCPLWAHSSSKRLCVGLEAFIFTRGVFTDKTLTSPQLLLTTDLISDIEPKTCLKSLFWKEGTGTLLNNVPELWGSSGTSVRSEALPPPFICIIAAVLHLKLRSIYLSCSSEVACSVHLLQREVHFLSPVWAACILYAGLSCTARPRATSL